MRLNDMVKDGMVKAIRGILYREFLEGSICRMPDVEEVTGSMIATLCEAERDGEVLTVVELVNEVVEYYQLEKMVEDNYKYSGWNDSLCPSYWEQFNRI